MKRPQEPILTRSSGFPYVGVRNVPVTRRSRLFAFVVLALASGAFLLDPELPNPVALLCAYMAGWELRNWSVWDELYGEGGEP